MVWEDNYYDKASSNMANILLGIHCAVPGCGSTLRKVNQWKVKACSNPRHKGKTHAQCMCPEPYQFFKFPTGIKLRKLWLERVKKPDLEINNLTRVRKNFLFT